MAGVTVNIILSILANGVVNDPNSDSTSHVEEVRLRLEAAARAPGCARPTATPKTNRRSAKRRSGKFGIDSVKGGGGEAEAG